MVAKDQEYFVDFIKAQLTKDSYNVQNILIVYGKRTFVTSNSLDIR
jgi:hypothetical protein